MPRICGPPSAASFAAASARKVAPKPATKRLSVGPHGLSLDLKKRAQQGPAPPIIIEAIPAPVYRAMDPIAATLLSENIRARGGVDAPLFCAADVAQHIGDTHYDRKIKSYSDAYARTIPAADTLGRVRDTLFLTEIGLYKYLLQSRSAAAEPFQQHVYRLLVTERKRVVDAALLAAKIARDDAANVREEAEQTSEDLEATREELTCAIAEAREARNTAALGNEEAAEASDEAERAEDELACAEVELARAVREHGFQRDDNDTPAAHAEWCAARLARESPGLSSAPISASELRDLREYYERGLRNKGYEHFRDVRAAAAPSPPMRRAPSIRELSAGLHGIPRFCTLCKEDHPGAPWWRPAN